MNTQKTQEQELNRKISDRLQADVETLMSDGLSEMDAMYLIMDVIDDLLEGARQRQAQKDRRDA